MTARIAQVLADFLRQMRATIKRNDARVMDHFGQNHRVTKSLRDSIVIVVADWKYRRPRTCPPKTPLVDRAVLGSVKAVFSSDFRALGKQLLGGLGQRRNSAVWRINDHCRLGSEGGNANLNGSANGRMFLTMELLVGRRGGRWTR